MKIVADENLAGVRELFGGLGDLVCLPGRGIRPADVRDADILLVRSVTKVGPALLGGSRVRFVGSATIGTDHMDLGWMAGEGIAAVSAPGCNARGVVDYVLASLAWLRQQGRLEWEHAVCGVVGLGNVGYQVALTLQGLGLEVLGCDPWVIRPEITRVELDGMLERADVLLMHAPLVRDGAWPTHHLMDAGRLARLGTRRILLNAGRGEVVDNAALLALIKEGRLDGLRVVLDVWEGEPSPDPQLLAGIALGTPHIAGYSRDGKVRGSLMILESLLRFLGDEVDQRVPRWHEPPPDLLELEGKGWDALCRLIGKAYPLPEDDARFRQAMDPTLSSAQRGQLFDRLRKEYWSRRDVTVREVRAAGCADALAVRLARAAGFRLVQA